MIAELITSLRLLLTMSVLTGIVYPVGIYGFSRVAWQQSAEGSLIVRDQQVLGSVFLAERTTSARYFFSRPSAANYATLPSGASNYGPISAAGKAEVEKRRDFWGAGAPAELLLASGSGLDPDISTAAARFQLDRVAAARSLSPTQKVELAALVDASTIQSDLGFLGEPRVNVLRLNLALDERFP